MRLTITLLLFAGRWPVVASAQDGAEFFRQKIRPIFSSRCQGCHNDTLKFSGLSLDSAAGLRTGGLHGAVVTPGNPQASRLYRRVARLEKPVMPMQGDPLTDDESGLVKRWIEMGAPWPEDAAAQNAEKAKQDRVAALKKLEDRRVITEKDREWWAFRKPVPPPAPAVKNGRWAANPIDAFVLTKIESKGLRPAPPASRRTLIRRLYFDLIGLPPRPEDVEAFLKDPPADAYPKLVDRLLDSEHYGERWGRHWLDVARYADSDGYEYDALRPNGWRYRDYVIRAFNRDKPYDRFIREQLAGDEIPDRDYDSLTGLGFCRNGPFIGDMVLMQNELTRSDELDDLVSATGAAFLGLTVGCARCHDHKYDPIPQKDYYRMVAVFFPSVRKDLPLAPPALADQYESRVKEIDSRIEPIHAQVTSLEKPTHERLLAAKYAKLPDPVQIALKTDPPKRTEAQKLQADQVAYSIKVPESEVLPELDAEVRKKVEALNTSITDLEKSKPAPLPLVQAVTDPGAEAPPSYFLHRGSVLSKGSQMTPGAISVLNPPGVDLEIPKPAPGARTTGRRLALANWIASADNPLTARVMVNRIWQHHFGQGLVGTPNDFGHMGEPPVNPELLDWLATEFIRQGWSIKAMHRLILNSRTYQQASAFDSPENTRIDPENHYLWRMPLQRVEGEIIRDSILAVSGGLNLKMGGPGVFPEVDSEILKGAAYQRWPQTKDGPEFWRRSVYVTEMRTITAPILDLFDPPDKVASCARRNVTTIAPQALQLLNDRFVAGQSEIFARRVLDEAGRERAAQIRRAFYLALSREPGTSEAAASLAFLKRQEEYHRRHNVALLERGVDPAEIASPEQAALVDFCHSLFNLNEFVYVN
jgi:Protein of unknown function (DUF1553)/Protein of unknown function (DUF1549)/Planctomycete cytochrome C